MSNMRVFLAAALTAVVFLVTGAPGWAGQVTADLSITKTDGVAAVTAGGSVVYTIVASNLGPSDTVGATVSDSFPASLSCSWVCVASAGSSCSAAGSGSISDSVNLLDGGMATYTATCTIDLAATGSLSNTATISGGSTTDPASGNDISTDIDTITGAADLSITKTDGVATVTAGDNVVYTIVASNAGPSDTTGATVSDAFPASLSCSWVCVASAGSNCTASGSGAINDSVDLLNGGNATYTATCAIDPAATGSLSNTATISGGSTADPNSGNDSNTDIDTIDASADLSISAVVAPSSLVAGDPFTVTVMVTNLGPSTATSASVSGVFSDPSIVDSTTGCAEDPLGVPTCSLGTLAPSQSISYVISGTAPDATVALTLTASSSASDPNSANDGAISQISGAPSDIPTLGEWGLLLMALLLLSAGLWRVRRPGLTG